jgi:hypothetical protein
MTKRQRLVLMRIARVCHPRRSWVIRRALRENNVSPKLVLVLKRYIQNVYRK